MQQASKEPGFVGKNGHFGLSEAARTWPADKVERRPTRDLVPSARNARLHSDDQVEQIAASITEFGWTAPVLIDEAGEIIAGHGRVLAAELLGIGDLPTMEARGWTGAMKRAYRIADNKLTLNGTWDDALLRIELNDLAALGIEGLTGFSEDELRDMGVGVQGLGGMPVLSDGDHSPFQQMTFILLESQGATVTAALEAAARPATDADENKNENGNALAEICRAYLGAHATS
jgi:hypothetical protein